MVSWFDLFTGPVCCVLCDRVEVVGSFSDDGFIVVATNAELEAVNVVHDRKRVRAVSYEVSEAEDAFDSPRINVLKNRLQRFEVAVNVGNDRYHKLFISCLAPRATCFVASGPFVLLNVTCPVKRVW